MAVKLCTAEDEQLRKRFYREAEISGNLHDPSIVTVFDSGVENGAPYLVQEYLGGEDLDRVIRRGDDLPQTRAAGVPDAGRQGVYATPTARAFCIATSSRATCACSKAAGPS